jgi:hypothetical protein
MSTWPGNELRKIAEADDLHISRMLFLLTVSLSYASVP